jgi:hypothetical protein
MRDRKDAGHFKSATEELTPKMNTEKALFGETPVLARSYRIRHGIKRARIMRARVDDCYVVRRLVVVSSQGLCSVALQEVWPYPAQANLDSMLAE